MSKSYSSRAYIASYLIDLFPSSIRTELLSDSELIAELGVPTDETINFGKAVSFRRDTLFNAIHNAFEDIEKESFLLDVGGAEWSLRKVPEADTVFSLNKESIQISIGAFWPLGFDIEKRLGRFKCEVEERRLSIDVYEYWRPALSVPRVSDDNVTDLLRDLDCSPKYIESLLEEELREGTNSISTLAPQDIRYYERLVGKYSGSGSIGEYCKNELARYFDNRKNGRIYENDLLLCMHRSISEDISARISDETQFKTIANQAIETCHPILLVSCIEVGVLSFRDSSKTIINMLFDCLASVRAKENLNLFCAMAMFIDGELTRLQLFSGMPPFYRRLASFAQAALVVKVALKEGVDFEGIEKWAANQRGLHFFCQNLVDLKDEPRWMPNYLNAEQFISELYGRVSNVCQEADGSEVVEYLQKELRTDSRLSLQSFLPGPLEGNSAPAVVPEDISNLLGEHIEGQASLDTFRVLMNSAPFWRIDSEYLDRAVSLLENAQHKLAAVKDKDSVNQVLVGLAQVSCMTRSRRLAASVMILSRMYREYIDIDSDPENYLSIGFVAGAAFDEKDGWSEYIGQWCTELAYLPINEESIGRVRSMLETFCLIEPYLYFTCSKPLNVLRMLSDK